MISANLHEIKSRLSHYVSLAEQGEEIILCRRNIPVVKITALKDSSSSRPLGLSKGELEVKDDFFDPLDEDTLRLFEV